MWKTQDPIARSLLPFGWVKSPFSTPVRSALLNWESKTAVDVVAVLLLAKIYFLMAGRLDDKMSQ
jgi:hypothetical protein